MSGKSPLCAKGLLGPGTHTQEGSRGARGWAERGLQRTGCKCPRVDTDKPMSSVFILLLGARDHPEPIRQEQDRELRGWGGAEARGLRGEVSRGDRGPESQQRGWPPASWRYAGPLAKRSPPIALPLKQKGKVTGINCLPCVRGFPGGPSGKELPCQRRRHETRAGSLGGEDPLEEEEMATHSSILAGSLRTEEPGGLQSKGSQSQTTGVT